MDATTLIVALLTLVAGVCLGLAYARSSASGPRAERDGLRTERDTLRAERAEAEERFRTTEAELARLTERLEHERSDSRRRDADDERMRETFEALSARLLRSNSEELAKLAETRLAAATKDARVDLNQRQLALEHLIAPVRDTLDKVEGQIRTVEKDRVGAHQALLDQIGTMRSSSEELRAETRQLVTALRAPQVRGRWGEMQLRRVVEAAGMVGHVDFDEQATSTTEDGTLRPDLVVRLAGGKNVVVDSKVPFLGFLQAMECRDETERTDRLRAHARHLRDHVNKLSAKAYWERFDPAPEFVVLFVPADTFLNAALEQEPGTLEYAFDKNVVIATPSTLIALLRTVAYTWRQDALADNARQVLKLGRELHNRLATMGGHIQGVGKALDTAVQRYNQAVSSLESRVLVTARRFAELRVTDEELVTPTQVEKAAREVAAPILVAGESVVQLPGPRSDNGHSDQARG